MMIRAARPEDVEIIGELWVKLAEYHTRLDPALPRVAADGAMHYARRIAGRLNDTHTCTLVAEDDGVIVGYVLGLLHDFVPEMFQQESGGFLADIYVEESHRGRGVGRALVMHLRDWFRAHKVEYMEWYVSANNEAGRAFWSAIGGRDLMVRMRASLEE